MGVLSNSPTNMDICIEACIKCLRACEECFTACLAEADVEKRMNCIKTLTDCAAICGLAVCYMARNSKHAKTLCQTCANICNACAQECEMFEDRHCKECAQICRECGIACREMTTSV